jgi:rhodanese-related sulfurtransferase
VLPDRITRETLYARLTCARRPVLVEALGAAFFADAHLPGAINIPPGQVDTLAPGLLPDLSAEIVVYCGGSRTSSVAVARRLEKLGYASVAVYHGGKEDWVEHGLPVERVDGGQPGP